MKVYHYTTIDTLALILKNGTIRFNRLDRVDDMEEFIYGSGKIGLKLSKYQFVSCWTKFERENILLWKLCGDNHGVRIGLDEDMFVSYYTFGIKSFFELPITHINDCIAISFQNEIKLHDIVYVSNPQKEIYNAVKNDGNVIDWNIGEIGKYKGKEWESQNECRFKINVLPFDESCISDCKDVFHTLYQLMTSISKSTIFNKDISLEYIDIKLSPDKMNKIEVMSAPQTSDAEKEKVRKMLESYPNSKFLFSRIDGMINPKKQ